MKNLENKTLQEMRENLIKSITLFGDKESKKYNNPIHIGNTFDGTKSIFMDSETDDTFVVSNSGHSITFDGSTESDTASLTAIFNHFTEQLDENDLLRPYFSQLLTEVKSAIKFKNEQIIKRHNIGGICLDIKSLKSLIMSNSSKKAQHTLLSSILEKLNKFGFIDSSLRILHNSEEIEITWFLRNLEALKNNLQVGTNLTSEMNLDYLIQMLISSSIPVRCSDGYHYDTFNELDDFIKSFIYENYFEDYEKQHFLVDALFDFISVNGLFDFTSLTIPNEENVSDVWKFVIKSIQDEFKRQGITDYENDDIFITDFFDALIGDYFRYQFENFTYNDVDSFVKYLSNLDEVSEFDNIIQTFGKFLNDIKVSTHIGDKIVFGNTQTEWQPLIRSMIKHNLLGTNIKYVYYNEHNIYPVNDLPTEPFTSVGTVENLKLIVSSLINKD